MRHHQLEIAIKWSPFSHLSIHPPCVSDSERPRRRRQKIAIGRSKIRCKAPRQDMAEPGKNYERLWKVGACRRREGAKAPSCKACSGLGRKLIGRTLDSRRTGLDGFA